jgi:predicted PurR-regulated permease PerM
LRALGFRARRSTGLVRVSVAEGVVLGIASGARGMPHAALLGGLTGVLAMIPFGAAAVYVIGALYLLPQGGIAPALVLVGVGIVVGFIADHYLRPAVLAAAIAVWREWVAAAMTPEG